MPTTGKTPAQTFAEALVAFQAEMPKVNKGKTATVPTKSGGSYKYTYADLADVSDTAIPLLGKHGFAFTSAPRRCENGDYELVGRLLHISGEADEGALPLIGRTAQEIGGSITYARRYLMGTMTGIVTDDDVDAQDRSTQRTSQPTPLELAQARVQQSFNQFVGYVAGYQEISDAYESDTGRKLAVAPVEDLSRWADDLDQQKRVRSAEAATQAAQRALGAQAAEHLLEGGPT